jgi:hypothetical protein
MIKKMILIITLSIIYISMSYASDLKVVSINDSFTETVLKDTDSGLIWQAKIGDVVAGYTIEGITDHHVTISVVKDNTVMMTELPVSTKSRVVKKNQIPKTR